MRCSQPFMRDHKGKVRKINALTQEQRLDMTPFPCGWCLPCRINRARMWQHRIMLESRSHHKNTFVTLTYEDGKVPFNDNADLILYKPDLQDYIKRLRKRRPNERIRYFAVGEYGSNTNRPHYHACLFGLGIADRTDIESAWRLKNEAIGIVHIGEITPESARYIAGYTIKKLTRNGDERLQGKPPEFMVSSKKDGGIGYDEVVRIAKRLKKNPYFDLDQIINTFTIGGKAFPLGGYLSEVLFNELGIDKNIKEEKLREYQEKLFMDNDVHTSDYYENIISNSEQYRKNLEAKQKIYKKQRKI